MAATLLACGGAGLIAGAPDWVMRMALAKTPPPLFATARIAQRPDNPTDDVTARTTIAEGGRSSQEPVAGTNQPARRGVDVATATDRLDLEYFLLERTCGAAPRFQPASEGDGDSEGNASADLWNPPAPTGCAAGMWTLEEQTDDLRRASHDLLAADNRTLDGRQDAVR
jgi:hypothetical protein